MSDQAASLRQWAAKRSEGDAANQAIAQPASTETNQANVEQVVVLGLPALTQENALDAVNVFHRWAAHGKKWVGDAERWRVIPVASDYPDLAKLVDTYPRWALWVDNDLDSFKRAYDALKTIQAIGGPKRIIALHPPMASRRGLLGNIQHVAQAYFGIDVLVFSG